MFFFFPAAVTFIGLPYIYLKIRNRQLRGEDLSVYDATPEPFAQAKPSKGLEQLNIHLQETFTGRAKPGTGKEGWALKRQTFDEMGLARDLPDVEFRPDVINIDGQEITGSWTLPPNYDPCKRLLYMHGGGFTVGSDISHRPLTAQFARRSGLCVFTPNYRLMPENSRRDGIDDARNAYQWILETGPDGPAPLDRFALAGDSAGGNLVLMLANWAREHTNRQADAIVALSPITDSTLSSASLKENLATDHMLRPMVAPILKAPKLLLLPAIARQFGIRPSDPDISPIHDDLSGLPPIFIQASSTEVLHDDAVRFSNKAKQAESPVIFQSWAGGLPHVWQIFDDYIEESNAAFDEIEVFFNKNIL